MALFTSGVSSSLWDKKTKIIPASATESVDEISLDIFKAAKYVIFISNGIDTIMFDMNIINKNSNIKESIYGKIGTGISFSIDTSVSLGLMSLKITNKETSSINTELIRYKFN